MTRVLITGAHGFIGRHLCLHLENGSNITALDKVCADRSTVRPAIRFVEGDITNDSMLDKLPREIDTVVHLAATTGIDALEKNPAQACRVNCEGTIRMLEYAKLAGAKHFVYVSTGSVYRPQRGLIGEDVAADPQNAYGFTKYLGELAALRYSKKFAVTILRLFHPYASDEPANNLISRMTEFIRSGKPIILHPGKRPLLSFIYISELMEVFSLVLERRPEVIINVASCNASIEEMCRLLGDAMGFQPCFVMNDKDVENEAADTKRMAALLGYKPAMDFETGLRSYLLGRGIIIR